MATIYDLVGARAENLLFSLYTLQTTIHSGATFDVAEIDFPPIVIPVASRIERISVAIGDMTGGPLFLSCVALHGQSAFDGPSIELTGNVLMTVNDDPATLGTLRNLAETDIVQFSVQASDAGDTVTNITVALLLSAIDHPVDVPLSEG